MFTGSCFVIVDISPKLPRHPKNGYRFRMDRKIDSLWVHHSGGAGSEKLDPIDWAMGTARYCVNVRDWPGHPYHLAIPYAPRRDLAGRAVVFQTWMPEFITYHTKGHNDNGLGLVLQGGFDNAEGRCDAPRHPSSAQLELLDAVFEEWVIPKYHLERKSLYGHADASKPTCPGWVAYEYVKLKRSGQTWRYLLP